MMLRYERAIGGLAEAGAAFQAGRGTLGPDRVGRAEAIVRELADGLDLAGGGSLAQELAGLYEYCRQRLGQAARTREARPVLEVAGLLEGLLDAWRQASQKLASTAPPTNHPTPEAG